MGKRLHPAPKPEVTQEPIVEEPPVEVPSLVESIRIWEDLSKEVAVRQAELDELLESAETLRRFLFERYGVAVRSLGMTLGSQAAEVPTMLQNPPVAAVEAVQPTGQGDATVYTPPPQTPIYDPVATGPLQEAQVAEIRKGASIPGASSEEFGKGVADVLGSIRKSFGG
jgi:hypothetical protein